MHIQLVTDNILWQKTVDTFGCNTFLHSLGWIDFNQQYGHKTWQLGLYDDANILISVALVLKISAKRGTFLFIPHGPQFMQHADGLDFQKTVQYTTLWRDYLINLGKDEQCDFIRISPIFPDFEETRNIFKAAGFKPSPIHMHAELTTVVDLRVSEKDILKNMRKTMRQMIKKGEKMLEAGEVRIEQVNIIDDEMHEVYQSTTQRGGFVPFSRQYLQKEYDAFAKLNNAVMCKVTYQKRVLSWGMFIFSAERAFYHQGANILDKNVPASYMSHWFGMQTAKKRGCVSYDFWGVGPKDVENHPWANISKFKRGFGGLDVQLVHAQDYPLRWKYWLNWIIETIRAKRRGF